MSALRQTTDRIAETNPLVTDPIVELDEALKVFEELVYSRTDPETRRLAFGEYVLYHERDFKGLA